MCKESFELDKLVKSKVEECREKRTFEKGVSKGIEIGKRAEQKTIQKIALALMDVLDIAIIAKKLELSVQEIEELKRRNDIMVNSRKSD